MLLRGLGFAMKDNTGHTNAIEKSSILKAPMIDRLQDWMHLLRVQPTDRVLSKIRLRRTSTTEQTQQPAFQRRLE